MDAMAMADGFDQYDCLFCKRMSGCSFGRAFLASSDFCYVTDSCLEHESLPTDEPVSELVGKRRVEVYGAQPWDDVGL